MANTNTSGTQQSTGGPQSLTYQLTSGKAYDPDAVYIDASDAKGHYEQMNVKLPPRLQHVIEILVADSDDLRSRQDFIRNALLHMAHSMASNGMRVPDPLAVRLVEAEASRAATEMRMRIREEEKQDFKRTAETIEDMLRDRDWPVINEELDRIALLSEDDGLPGGVRERYSALWEEMNNAVAARQFMEIRKKTND